MSEKKNSITGDDIRRFIPLYSDLAKLAGIADAILENAALAAERPPPDEDEDLVDDKLGGRLLRVANDSAEALPELASAAAVLKHGRTAPAAAAAVLIQAAAELLRKEQALQRLARPLSASELARIEAANRLLPDLGRAIQVLDDIPR